MGKDLSFSNLSTLAPTFSHKSTLHKNKIKNKLIQNWKKEENPELNYWDLVYTVGRNKHVHVIDLQNGNFTKLDSTKRRKHLGILSNNFYACNKKFVS